MLALHFHATDTPPRIGLAVSRKVDRHAVGRNRIKRVLRETFRRLRAQLDSGDYVVVARGAAAGSDNQALRDAFVTLLQRAGALPQAGSGGTIPPATNLPAASADSRSHPASDSSGGSSLPA